MSGYSRSPTGCADCWWLATRGHGDGTEQPGSRAAVQPIGCPDWSTALDYLPITFSEPSGIRCYAPAVVDGARTA
jgi:hypothetical protein